MDDLRAAIAEARALINGSQALVKATAGGRVKGKTPKWRRIECRPVHLKAGERLQITEFDETQAHTRNVEWGDPAARAMDELFAQPFGHWHVATTTGDFSFRVSKAGKVLVTRRAVEREQSTTHDRTKTRLVEPDEPFLFELGLTTESGRVKAGRADKYHQINEFVRILDAAVTDGMRAGRLRADSLRIVDLGCGNAYLTFAAFHHLAATVSPKVEIVGVDVKKQSRDHNVAVASRLGWSDQVSFVSDTISGAMLAPPIDIVLALHACDTATDEALARAIQWQAPLILAAPCCHHDIQRQLRLASTPSPYRLVTRHGLLLERFGDVLTDALRADILRMRGYRTDVIEFVDSRHTPRNSLLRAHLTGAQVPPDQQAEYDALVTAWNLRPHLAGLLSPD